MFRVRFYDQEEITAKLAAPENRRHQFERPGAQGRIEVRVLKELQRVGMTCVGQDDAGFDLYDRIPASVPVAKPPRKRSSCPNCGFTGERISRRRSS